MTRRQFLATSAGVFVPVLIRAAVPPGFVRVDGLKKPTSYANCQLWLNSLSLGSLADGDPIAAWADSSGNGRDATQGTGANQPLKQTLTVGSRTYPVYTNDASVKYLSTSSFLGSSFNTACTIICAHKSLLVSLYVFASNGGINLFCAQQTDAVFNTNSLSDTQITASVFSNSPHMMIQTFRYDGASKIVRTNGFQRKQENATGNLGLSGALTIGRISSGGFDYSGSIAQFLMYDRALSDRELLSLERYLALQVGISVAPVIVCDGDSITFGTCATAGMSYPDQLVRLLGSQWALTNSGAIGETVAQMTSTAPNLVDPCITGFDRRQIVCLFGGTNDLYFGADASTTYNRIVTYCQARQAAGWKVITFTLLPRSDGGTPVTFEADRQTVNTSIRNNWTTFADALCDVGGDATIGAPGASTNPTYYCDGVHLTDAGYAIVAGLANTAVLSIT